MGAVLSHKSFVAGFPSDFRFHLRALYTDPRGINLRNQVARGVAPHALLRRGLGNWVVHSLLLLGSLHLNAPLT
jgi:lysyl-tRNA synthetase class 1